jgi:hypothetical protein
VSGSRQRTRTGIAGLTAVLLVALAAALAPPALARTVWLCHPGQRPDPCAPGLSTSVEAPDLTSTERTTTPAPSPNARRVDCFYVYPTVSDQTGPFANLTIDPEERSIALQQAARFSQLCRVWAPMYRQGTLPALLRGTAQAIRRQMTVPLRSISAAFRDYLAHDNDGRPFVIIGHSQGAILMRRVIAAQVDDHPAVRRRMLSAILLGGNVLVRRGADVGGDFSHIPACRTGASLHCVIAFSTFDAPPPANTLFGVSPTPRESVLCTDPARLSGTGDLIGPIYASAPFAPGTLIAAALSLMHLPLPSVATTWISAPDSYAARCTTGPGAHVLLVTPRLGAPLPTPSPDPGWGLHLLDASIAMGNLLAIVRRETRAYAAAPAAAAGGRIALHTRSR